MDLGLALAVMLALAFAVTNGLHDAANAIAALVATRAARPKQAIVLGPSSTCSARCLLARRSPTPSAASLPSHRQRPPR